MAREKILVIGIKCKKNIVIINYFMNKIPLIEIKYQSLDIH